MSKTDSANLIRSMQAGSARAIYNSRYTFWVVALLVACIPLFAGEARMPWAFDYPEKWEIPLQSVISSFMRWLIEDVHFGLFTFKEMTRAIAWLLEQPYNLIGDILWKGFVSGQGSAAVQIIPPVSWIAIVAIIVCIGRFAKNWALAGVAGGCFLYVAVFGQWQSAMITLSSIVIAVPMGVVVGMPFAIAAYRHPRFERALIPVLDLMQTVPIFAYLVPILFMFGFGPVAAMIATMVYAIPPMIRITVLALKGTAGEIIDLGNMVGCTPRQMTWKVLVPAAKSSIMVGVNQVIMLSLNMVIIASMIGAGGLGYDVLTALKKLDIGGGIESGFAIVALAIALDRVTQAMANKGTSEHHIEGLRLNYWRRHPYVTTCLAIILFTGLAGLLWPPLQSYPKEWVISTGSLWNDIVRHININYYDVLNGIKTFLLLNLLLPLKKFLLAVPWLTTTLLLAACGYVLGRWRLALFCTGMCLFIASVGLWEKAMITVYLCGIAVVIAGIIGIPIGILTAGNDRAWRITQVAIDTLQTLHPLYT